MKAQSLLGHLEYAQRHARVGNYDVALSSLGAAAEMVVASLPLSSVASTHRCLATFFLRLAGRMHLDGMRHLARKSLLFSIDHYALGDAAIPARTKSNWMQYLDSTDPDFQLDLTVPDWQFTYMLDDAPRESERSVECDSYQRCRSLNDWSVY